MTNYYVRTGCGMQHCDPECRLKLVQLMNVDRRLPDEFERRLGERLRPVREDQRLTLRAVEVLSHGRFNPVTLAACERGDRALKVETAAELAWLYGVPLAELLSAHCPQDSENG